MREADGYIQDTGAGRDNTSESALMAHRKISEGIDILSHHQKLVKLADSSEHGWKIVQEYEAQPLAEDSDDEKKIYRAQMKAERKANQERRNRTRRFRPYGNPTAIDTSGSTSSQQQGRYQGNKKKQQEIASGAVPRGIGVKIARLIFRKNNAKISKTISSVSVRQVGPEE